VHAIWIGALVTLVWRKVWIANLHALSHVSELWSLANSQRKLVSYGELRDKNSGLVRIQAHAFLFLRLVVQ
jgi:alpha-D-ribose 1-methylphosphonate 5-triphosphate synthase subunit PhnG